jgi:hypothetical protein
MKVLAATLISLSLFAWAASHAHIGAAQVDSSSTASAQDSRSINITRSGSQQPIKGPAEHFTGSVQVEPFSCARSIAHKRWEGHVRTRRAECIAYASARSNVDRDRGHGLDSAVGRPD